MMESKREDARIQRTYSLLLGALTELLEEKPFEEIRITDLCERAGVHRSTFYAHFEDKHHLLTFAIQELMDILVSFVPTTTQEIYEYSIRRVFKYFLKNQKMYTLLFLDPKNVSAKNLFRRTFIRASDQLLKRSFPAVPTADLAMYSRHFIGGLLTVVDWWLENDADTPLDQMAKQFVRLIPNYYSVFSEFEREFDM